MAKVFALEELTPPVYSWKVHPARERPKIALATAAVIVCAAWLVAELMQQPAWGVFGGIVLVVGCNRFFFPTSYELTEEDITARYPLKTIRHQWAELRRFLYDRKGGFLSPRVKGSMLDEHRGISLLFGERGDKAERIVQEILKRLPKEAIVREIASKKKRVAGVDRREPPEIASESLLLGASLRSDPSHPRHDPSHPAEEVTSCGG